MKSVWLELSGVQVALWGLYALIPWLALRRWLTREVWPVRLALALLAGLVSQMLIGFCWSRWVCQPAWLEGLYYVGLWVLLGVVFHLLKPTPHAGDARNSLTLFDQLCFVMLLVLGLGIRLRHPIQVMALGQSDAYAHLAMFREIVASGFLVNAAYPSGYAWLMGMPASLLRIDPYSMARFGGAFWGLALCVSVYGFLREGFRDKRAAMLGAFLTATFPGLMLLHKTGVGAFANQPGLFFLPLVFTGVLLTTTRMRRRPGAMVLLFSCIGILLATPMMLLHAGVVLLLYYSVHGWKTWRFIPRRWLRWLWALVPLLLLAGFYLVRFGGRTLSMTARILTTADEAASANLSQVTLDVWTSIRLLLVDFFSLKRWGLGSPLLDGVFLLLLVLFVSLLVVGVRRKQASWVMLGCWGGAAALQTATGFLQFTAYQREGWSLLIAVACLGGMMGAWFWVRFRWIRSLIILALLSAAGVTLWHAPSHPLTNSTAEDLMVRLARQLRAYPTILPFPDSSMKGISGFIHTYMNTNESLSLITRPLLQDQMLSSVAGVNEQIWVSKWDLYLDPEMGLQHSYQSLILLDRADSQDVASLGAFAAISPVAAGHFIQQQQISYRFNEQLEAHIQALSADVWQVVRYDADPNLRLYLVKPLREDGREP